MFFREPAPTVYKMHKSYSRGYAEPVLVYPDTPPRDHYHRSQPVEYRTVPYPPPPSWHSSKDSTQRYSSRHSPPRHYHSPPRHHHSPPRHRRTPPRDYDPAPRYKESSSHYQEPVLKEDDASWLSGQRPHYVDVSRIICQMDFNNHLDHGFIF